MDMVKLIIGRHRRLYRHICSITWSCPICGRPFTTELEKNLHMLQCGK